jgi:ankyrin repeat protein
MNRQLLGDLTTLVPWKRLRQPSVVHSISRTESALKILVPEEYDGQHRALAERCCDGKHSAIDIFAVDMFLWSNNIISQRTTGKTFDSMESHDAHVMKMLRQSGWNSVAQIRFLLESKEPTAWALVEQLFASALRALDRDVVKLMLEAGVDPDVPIDTVSHGPQTPLQYLSSVGTRSYSTLEFIKLLLSYKAGVDTTYRETMALEYAVELDHEDVVDLLLGRGARITPSCLAAAAGKIADPVLFSQFLGPATHIDIRSGWPLAEAVRSGRVAIVDLLLANGADVNALVGIDFDGAWGLTTILGVAVESNEVEIIKVLLAACPEVNPELHGLPFVSPLALAVDSGKTDHRVIDLLLSAGVDIHAADCSGDIPLLERALQSNNIAACEVLIHAGARIERPLSEKDQHTSALLGAVKRGATNVYTPLIARGARLNDIYIESPGTVLGAAIEKGDIRLIQMLLRAGAVALSPTLERIGNTDTAIYLQRLGIMQRILSVSGTRMLVAAISAKDERLAHWLMYQNATHNFLQTNQVGFASYANDTTPLQAAIRSGRLSLIHLMLDSGLNVTDGELTTALEYDGQENAEDILRFILRRLSGKAPTAVAAAIMGRRWEVVRLLLAGGVDPTGMPLEILQYWRRDGHNALPLEFPVSVLELLPRYSSPPLLKWLLHVYKWEPIAVCRALTLSIIYNRADMIECLMEYTVNVNYETIICQFEGEFEVEGCVPALVYNEVFTPLQAAAKYQRVSAAKRLLEHSTIDINYLGDGLRRQTALQHAVDNANMDLVNLLLEHGANVNTGPASDGGATALQLAAIRGYIGIAQRLFELNADVDAPPAEFNGRSALEGAAENGRIDTLQMLLDAGASVTGVVGERQYRRAVYLAQRNGHHAAARLLKEFRERVE